MYFLHVFQVPSPTLELPAYMEAVNASQLYFPVNVPLLYLQNICSLSNVSKLSFKLHTNFVTIFNSPVNIPQPSFNYNTQRGTLTCELNIATLIIDYHILLNSNVNVPQLILPSTSIFNVVALNSPVNIPQLMLPSTSIFNVATLNSTDNIPQHNLTLIN